MKELDDEMLEGITGGAVHTYTSKNAGHAACPFCHTDIRFDLLVNTDSTYAGVLPNVCPTCGADISCNKRNLALTFTEKSGGMLTLTPPKSSGPILLQKDH